MRRRTREALQFIALTLSGPLFFALLLALFLALGGCAQPGEPRTITKTVILPGELRSCVPPGMRAEPAYPDTPEALLAAPDAAARYQLVTAGRALRVARAGEVEPVLRGCR